MTEKDVKEITEVAKQKLKESGNIYFDHILAYISYLESQIEKMKSFIHSEIDFCIYCPLTNGCENNEGTCPYACATEEEQKNLLLDFINKSGS